MAEPVPVRETHHERLIRLKRVTVAGTLATFGVVVALVAAHPVGSAAAAGGGSAGGGGGAGTGAGSMPLQQSGGDFFGNAATQPQLFANGAVSRGSGRAFGSGGS